MFDYDGAYDGKFAEKEVTEMFPNMVKESVNKFDLGPLYELTGRLPKLPCGHDDVEGHKVLGSHILSKILSSVIPLSIALFLFTAGQEITDGNTGSIYSTSSLCNLNTHISLV